MRVMGDMTRVCCLLFCWFRQVALGLVTVRSGWLVLLHASAVQGPETKPNMTEPNLTQPDELMKPD